MPAINKFFVVSDAQSVDSILPDVMYTADVDMLIRVILGGGSQARNEHITLYPFTSQGKIEAMTDAKDRLSKAGARSPMPESLVNSITASAEEQWQSLSEQQKQEYKSFASFVQEWASEHWKQDFLSRFERTK